MIRKSRIGKGIHHYPHKLWISLCMDSRGMGFVREMQGSARDGEKNTILAKRMKINRLSVKHCKNTQVSDRSGRGIAKR